MRKSLILLILYITAFATILLSGVAFPIEKFVLPLQLFLVCVGVILSITSATRYPFSSIPRIIIFVTLGCMLLIVLTSGDELIRCAYKIILFLMLFGVTKYTRRNHIDYLEIVFIVFSVIAIMAFVGFLLVNFCGFEKFAYPVDDYVNGFCGIYYYDKYLERSIGVFSFYRFAGIFWEPGLFGCYASIALMYNLFFRVGKRKGLFTLFYFITCLFSLSVTAIGLSMVLLAFSFWNDSRVKADQRKKIGVMLSFIAVIGCLTIFWYKSQLPSVVHIRGVGYNSMDVRWMDLVVGWKLFWRNLPFGIGYNNMMPFEKEFKSIIGYQRPCSNGVINWLFQTGIPGLIYMVFPYALLFGKRLKLKTSIPLGNMYKSLLFLLMCSVLLITNMSEPIYVLPVMGTITGYLYDRAIDLNGGGLWTEKQIMFKDCFTVECSSSADAEKEMK